VLLRRDRYSEEVILSQLVLVLQRLVVPRELRELQDLVVQLQRQLQVEVYLEAQQLALACSAQHRKASQRHQPSQQAPSLEVVALLLLVDHCLEVPALSQQPLDHYSAGHRLLRSP